MGTFGMTPGPFEYGTGMAVLGEQLDKPRGSAKV